MINSFKIALQKNYNSYTYYILDVIYNDNNVYIKYIDSIKNVINLNQLNSKVSYIPKITKNYYGDEYINSFIVLGNLKTISYHTIIYSFKYKFENQRKIKSNKFTLSNVINYMIHYHKYLILQ